MMFKIKNHWTGELLYQCELSAEFADKSYDLQLGFAVRQAISVNANLRGANLHDANGEKLTLIGDRPYFQVGPIGSETRQFIAYITDDGLYLRAGCFFGTRDEFVAKLERAHGDNVHGKEYTAALALIDAHVKLWTPTDDEEQSS